MSKHSKIIFFLSILSLIISIYIEYIKAKIHQDKNYDIKCYRVLNSEFSSGFGFSFLPETLLKTSNFVYGMIFYTIMCLLSKLKNKLVINKSRWL